MIMNGREDDLVVSISNDYIEIYYLKLRDSSRDRLTKVWIMEYVQESQIVLKNNNLPNYNWKPACRFSIDL